ncbi:MAG: type II toxin-antitoxin system HicB family antitoxin [Saprospiraceae bacterium]|nr:type II toxin-antitoxin system HicB family antitoxin [Saprospiraceae bacterium]
MGSESLVQPPLIFQVIEELDGGFSAKSAKYGIYTQGDTKEELLQNIKEAIICHFEDGEAPQKFFLKNQKKKKSPTISNAPHLKRPKKAGSQAQ